MALITSKYREHVRAKWAIDAPCAAVLLSSKYDKLFLGLLRSRILCLDNKNKKNSGDLIEVSAKKEPLLCRALTMCQNSIMTR